MSESTESNRHVKAATWVLVATLAAALLAVAALKVGIADPFPASLAATPQPAFALAASPFAPAQRWMDGPDGWVHARLVADPGSMPANAALLTGSPRRHVGIGFSNEGYAAVWLRENEMVTWLVPWQPWPHVRAAAGNQEIHLQRRDDAIRVWINRELFWTAGSTDFDDQIGVQAEALEATTTVNFSALTVSGR